MSTMVIELYDALKEAGASDEKAKAAATVFAVDSSRFDRIDYDISIVKADLSAIKTDLSGVKADVLAGKSDVAGMRTEMAVVKAELAMVKWIVSGVGFGVLLLVLRSFWPG